MATVDTIAPAVGTACVSLAAVKQRFGIPLDDPTADDDLRDTIDTASEICRAVIGRAPWRQVYEEIATGRGEVDLFPHHWPLEGVDAVEIGGEAVDPSTYRVIGRKLRRLGGAVWPRCDITLTYRAGWLVPGQVGAWVATTDVPRGLFVPAGPVWAEATTPGQTGAAEPAWPTEVDATVDDGAVTWIVRAAHPAEPVLKACAKGLTVLVDSGYLEVEPGIASETDGDTSIRYATTSNNTHHAAINNRVRDLLRRYR